MPIGQAGRRALACLALFIAAAAAQAATKVTLTSPVGEPLLGGIGTKVYTAPTATIATQAYPDAVRILVDQGTDHFDIEMKMPAGVYGVEEGNFLLAEHARMRTGTAPGIEVRTHNGECHDVWGSFKIRQFAETGTYPDNQVRKLEATFVYRCGASNAPALTGTILIDAGPRYFSYSRDAGMTMGTASAKTYYGDNSDTSFEGQGNHMTIGVSGQRDEWLFYFKPPMGQTFAKGIYAIADGPDETHGSLNWYDNHQGFCPGLSGSLNVRNIAYDPAGDISAVYATWTLYCDGQPAAFRGTFRHDL